MSKVVFVTGNQHKADYFAQLAGVVIDHKAVEYHEIQSLDLKEVATEKARAAYKMLKRPVIIEDTALTIHSMGKLPGTYIKWFIEELGFEKLCRLADIDPNRSASCSSLYVYFDGKKHTYFGGELKGAIADHPRGASGFGWNRTFVPEGQNLTLGEMPNETFKKYYLKVKPLDKVGEFIRKLDK